MKRRVRLLSPRILIAAVLALGMAGAITACAPAISKIPHVGPTGIHPGASPGATTTPTPTPTALAAPVTRVTKTCTDLVSPAALTAAIGVAVPFVPADASDTFSQPFVQDGALTCHWSSNKAQDQLENSNFLVVWVLPDVTTTAWTKATTVLGQIGETKTTLINGKAYGWCTQGSTSHQTVCNVDTLVGTTWLSFQDESLTKPYTTSSAGLTHIAALINPIVAQAGAAGFITEPRWTDPAATATPATCAGTLPNSEIQTVAGVSGVGGIGPDLSDQQSLAEFWGAAANLGEVECDLASGNQQSGFFALVIPGGGWAWSLRQTYDSGLPGYAQVPSLGTQAVEFTNSNKDETIEWVRGHNVITLTVSGLANNAKNASVALVLATYINGKIAG